MNWELHLRKKAKKALLRFPEEDQRRIALVLHEIATNPYAGDIEKMGGEDSTWRRRVGAYRIFYQVLVIEKAIYVFRIESRTSKTY